MKYLLQSVIPNFVLFLVVLLGLVGLMMRLWNRSDRTAGLLGLALLAPVLSFSVYRDTYPYFYPFILAPVLILAGFVWDDLRGRFGVSLSVVLGIAVCISATSVTVGQAQRNIETQRTTLDVIHRLFPDEVAYIDGRSMVSSQSKRGPFMSTWGMRDYRREARPVMADIMRSYQPQFMLANTWHLQIDRLSPTKSEERRLGLLADDISVLQDNFAQLWGPLYVPAKSIVAGNQGIDVLISGTYRLGAEAPIQINGTTLEPNAEIHLEMGTYTVSAFENSQLILNVEQPSEAPPKGALFGKF